MKMTNDVNLSLDSKGTPTLFLKGSWSIDVERALASEGWQAVAIFGVDWPDYQCLVPFSEKVGWLRVPLGPDSSKGMERLNNLSKLEVTDVLSPSVDFRRLPKLKCLETIWDKHCSTFLSHPGLEVLILHSAKSEDLRWIPVNSALRWGQ